jgi:hypothetical protein
MEDAIDACFYGGGDYTEAAAAALDAMLDILVRMEMVVVPSEPTEAMDQAGADISKRWNDTLARNEVPRYSLWKTSYRAMLAASQVDSKP